MTTVATPTAFVDGQSAPVMGRAAVRSLTSMSAVPAVSAVASVTALGKGDVRGKGPAIYLQSGGYDGRLFE